MHHRFVRCFSVLGCLAVGVWSSIAVPARATTLKMLDSIDLVSRADAIVVGRVQSINSHWNNGHQFIVTDVEVVVTRAVKGKELVRLTVRQLGGRVGDVTQEVDGAPRFETGRDVLLFLRRAAGEPVYGVMGLSQGKFDLEPAAGGRQRLERRIDGTPQAGLRDATKPSVTWQYLDEFLADPGVDVE